VAVVALGLLSLPDPPQPFLLLAMNWPWEFGGSPRLKTECSRRLSVIGYDDIELAHFAQLTTIRQHLFGRGQGVELLLDADNSETSPTNFNSY
jgi:hypothetical protein